MTSPLGSISKRYALSGERALEEYEDDGTVSSSFVFGAYLDNLLQVETAGQTLWYVQDDLASVRAMVDELGLVVERVEYEDYGKPSFSTVSGGSVPFSMLESPRLFTGRPYDIETGWYHQRYRYLDPEEGRFTTRDPIGVWGDGLNFGNAYAYAGNSPASRVDPLGLNTIRDRNEQERLVLGQIGAGDLSTSAGGILQAKTETAVAREVLEVLSEEAYNLSPMGSLAPFAEEDASITAKVVAGGLVVAGVLSAGLADDLFNAARRLWNKRVASKARRRADAPSPSDSPGGSASFDGNVGEATPTVAEELPEAARGGASGGTRSGKAFTKKGKAEIDAENATTHGGVNTCETCDTAVVPGQRSQKGVTPPRNERQRDHIIPKSKGGDGSPSNGQVLCRGCNLEKSDN